MYDPTSQNRKENEDYENKDIEESDDNGSEIDNEKFERDKARYRSEVKFHYLITETGEIGKALPNFMELQNAYPGEPRLLRKRKHPKSLRVLVLRSMNDGMMFKTVWKIMKSIKIV